MYTSAMRKSVIALLKVQERALELGAAVSLPIVEGLRYDCIIDMNGKLHRVQVKYADSHRTGCSGSVQLSLIRYKGRGCSRPYSADEVDALLTYVPKIDKVCWFDIDVFAGKTNINIRYAPAKNKQKSRVIIAQDYIW